jgi:hypothetical protein
MQRCAVIQSKKKRKKALLENKGMPVSEHDAVALDGMQCDAMRQWRRRKQRGKRKGYLS